MDQCNSSHCRNSSQKNSYYALLVRNCRSPKPLWLRLWAMSSWQVCTCTLTRANDSLKDDSTSTASQNIKMVRKKVPKAKVLGSIVVHFLSTVTISTAERKVEVNEQGLTVLSAAFWGVPLLAHSNELLQTQALQTAKFEVVDEKKHQSNKMSRFDYRRWFDVLKRANLEIGLKPWIVKFVSNSLLSIPTYNFTIATVKGRRAARHRNAGLAHVRTLVDAPVTAPGTSAPSASTKGGGSLQVCLTSLPWRLPNKWFFQGAGSSPLVSPKARHWPGMPIVWD